MINTDNDFIETIETLLENIHSTETQMFLNEAISYSYDMGVDFDDRAYDTSYGSIEERYDPIHQVKVIAISSNEGETLAYYLQESLTVEQKGTFEAFKEANLCPIDEYYVLVAHEHIGRTGQEKATLMGVFRSQEEALEKGKESYQEKGNTIETTISEFYEALNKEQLNLFEVTVDVKHRNSIDKRHAFFDVQVENLSPKPEINEALAKFCEMKWSDTQLEAQEFIDTYQGLTQLYEYLETIKATKVEVLLNEEEMWNLSYTVEDDVLCADIVYEFSIESQMTKQINTIIDSTNKLCISNLSEDVYEFCNVSEEDCLDQNKSIER